MNADCGCEAAFPRLVDKDPSGALTGTHLWADRFDGSLEGVFDLQDQVAIRVAGVIEPTLQATEIRHSADRPTNDLTAYDLYLRALPHWGSYEKDRIVQALELLGQAIERDPHYCPALALAAYIRQLLAANDWMDDLETNRRKGLDLARRPLRFAPDEPEVLAFAGFALGHFGEGINVAIINVAIRLIERSLALNPSFARGWAHSGVARLLAGQPDLAIEHFKKSLRLSPRNRIGNTGTGLGGAHFFSRRFDDAAAILLSALETAPTFPVTYRYLASWYSHMGRLDGSGGTANRLERAGFEGRAEITAAVTAGCCTGRRTSAAGLSSRKPS